MTAGRLKNVIMLLFFYPVYFTLSGIYGVESQSGRGLIFPFTVILGIYCALAVGLNLLRHPKVKVGSKLPLMFLVLVYLIVIHTLIGFGLFNNISSVLVNIQYLSGVLGVFISIYLIRYRKQSVKELFFNISIVFLVAIISNLSLSIVNVGLMQTFSRHIYPFTVLGGIHQIYVYYPYIVSVVFLFALPLWERRSKLTIPVYLLVTAYILVLQVRGAVISYLLGLFTYNLMFSRRSKILNTVIILLMIAFMFYVFPIDVLFGRFINTSSSVISGRENVWKVYIENLIEDPLYIVRGSYSKGSTAHLFSGDPFQQGIGHSYHNQYIEVLDSYGAFIFIVFTGSLLYYLFLCTRKIRESNLDSSIYNYWITLVVYHFLIDLNVNVPLRVTNPAIMYLFYWTSLYLSIQHAWASGFID